MNLRRLVCTGTDGFGSSTNALALTEVLFPQPQPSECPPITTAFLLDSIWFKCDDHGEQNDSDLREETMAKIMATRQARFMDVIIL
mmetsp:Transcript_28304/g.60342  ORF Transcript_28304/g.60342 Transcript_28304/m.60342 type:complete len:86 (-) Transcript_28304:353-610(-)